MNKMKTLSTAAYDCKKKNVGKRTFHRFKRNTASLLCMTIIAVLFGACKQDVNKPKDQTSASKQMNTDAEFVAACKGLNWETVKQLREARAATAKYRDINNAFRDGYADIHLVMPNMGYHFMKMKIVDSTFNIRKPEILVYNKTDDGSFELLAVEYGIPIASSPDAPEGFAGHEDIWDKNTANSGLWTLHAWVWKFNPDGVFHPTNSDVVVK